jgi:hypothetical protein
MPPSSPGTYHQDTLLNLMRYLRVKQVALQPQHLILLGPRRKTP